MKQAPLYASVGQQIGEISDPEVVVGQIKNIAPRATDLKPVISVLLNDGTLHHNVDVLFCGGTNGAGYVHQPLEIGGYVYCLKTFSNAPLVAIGGALKPAEIGFEQGLSVADDNSDRKSYNVRDLVLYNDGNKINLTHLNGIVIDSERTIRMQLGENAALRVSRFGQTQDNTLDGSEFIDNLFAYIKELEDKINQHSQWIQNATPIVNQQFVAAAGVHTTAATAARALQPPNEPLAQLEDANAREDNQAAADTLALGEGAGTALSTTTEVAKDYARQALNPYIQTPFKG
jgi:hypothetical protein